MVAYGGEALPTETGRRMRTNAGTGVSVPCADTVRSASVLLLGDGVARWRWVGDTSCGAGEGRSMVAVDEQGTYSVKASGMIVLALAPLMTGPTIPETPPSPVLLELARVGSDDLVFEATSLEAGPLGAPDILPGELFRVVWRRVD